MAKNKNRSANEPGNLKKYALLGGAVAALPAAAQATVITVPVNVTVTSTNPDTTYDLTANNGPDLTFSAIDDTTFGYNKNEVYPASGSGYEANVGDPVYPLDLQPGDTVGSSDTFNTTNPSTVSGSPTTPGGTGNFPADGTIGYLGFEMPGNSGTDYGYVVLSTTATSTESSFTIYDFVYDDSGQPVTVAGVPEPSSLALFAAGAIGVETLRRRRKTLKK